MPYIIREIAKSMDLDPDLVSNNMDEAMKQAMALQAMQPAQPEMPPQGGEMAPPSPADTPGTGGGNIGIGQAPTPGEEGFSGNVPQSIQ